MIVDITGPEFEVIEKLRALKKHTGHGTLRVEVLDGNEDLIRFEFSQKLARPQKKALDRI